ncbi:MAG TPA: LuxR C-terminal-related transcriptional regulator [Hanamia sp.]|nr:LuxR C-terminal-related transcriptional regulator [Hanamia sp.]
MPDDISFFLKGDLAYLRRREILESLLSSHRIYHPVITKEQQKKQLDILDQQIPLESFYFVVNFRTCEIEQINGVKKWLGYSNKEFTLSQYLKSVHPDHVVLFNLIANCMYRVLFQEIFRIRFNTQKYISMVALRHYNGEYYVYKKTSSAFQLDDKNHILAQLNVFKRIELYDGDALKPRIEEMEEAMREKFEKMVDQMVYTYMVEQRYFSKQEFEVLKYYAEDLHRTSNEVAQKMNLKPATIDTYNKRILEKSRNIFTHPFSNAREVAQRLKREKILS